MFTGKRVLITGAAAYKHVPMMEDNLAQVIRNNVNGTRVIEDLAVKYGTKKFVMISTDKAVNTMNVMVCSKRICEIYCQSLNKAIVEGMITLSGAKDIDLKFTGLRDGEKIFEEVLNSAEGTKPTHHLKIMIAQVRESDYEVAKHNEDELLQLSCTHDDMAIVKEMKEIVPEFESKHSKFIGLDK